MRRQDSRRRTFASAALRRESFARGYVNMPGCLLRVVGEAFEPEPVLAGMSLRPYAVFRKGDKRFPENPRSTKIYDTGGFKCDVSSVDDDLAGQVKDAIAFLTAHYDDLRQLASVSAIELKYLDF